MSPIFVLMRAMLFCDETQRIDKAEAIGHTPGGFARHAMTVNLPSLPSRLRTLVLVAFFASLGLGEGLSQGMLVAVLVAAAWAGVNENFARVRALWQLWPVRLLVAFVLWHLAVAPLVPFTAHALRSAALFVNFAGLVAVPALMTEKDERAALTALVCGVALSAAYGVAQYFFGFSFGAELFGVSPTRWQVPVPNDPSHYVASGFFYNRLKLAHVIVCALLFALPALAGFRRRAQLLLGLLLALAMLALALTFTRAAAFALLCTVLVTFAWRGVSKWWLVGLAVAGAAASFVAPIRARLLSAFTASSYEDRFFLWARAREIIHDHPWLGVGWHNYGRICSEYYDRVDPSFVMRTEAHNQFLTTWAEGGVVALALWLAFSLSLGYALARRFGSASARGACAVLIALTLLSFMHDVFFHPIVTVTAFALFGCGLLARPRE